MLDVAKQIPLISMDCFGACVREILADSKHEHHMKTYGLRSDVMTLEEMAAVFNKTFKPEHTFTAIPVSCDRCTCSTPCPNCPNRLFAFSCYTWNCQMAKNIL